MAPSVVVVIREDPFVSAKPVEALRIALGLSTGENPLTVVLLNEAPRLLGEEQEDVVDGDILEKYLPSLKQLEIPFVLEEGETLYSTLDPEFRVREASRGDIGSLVSAGDRVLVF